MAAVNLRHIEIFHAVMTAGSLTEAAHLLHTSQPTVSRELARFEKVIGLKLFERIRGRLHPTVQGLRLFEEVQRSWYGLDRIVYCLPAGLFAIFFTAAPATLSGTLSRCQLKYRAPGITAT